jgi:UDP-N-acetylglucosamine--N-acetylmuramyl-(pentapeptide) pyrophosphoryl-undecaprenol N-acetylglucosamine transferase
LGGSLGARRLNGLIRESLGELVKGYTVIHQTGPEDGRKAEAAEHYKPYPFFREELPHIIAAAELVVCRSGAGTIWECASLGKPMILVPLSGSGTRGDQVENARYLEKAGAAVVLEEGGGPGALIGLVKALAADGQRRLSLGEAAARLASADGAALIARAIRDFLGGSRAS